MESGKAQDMQDLLLAGLGRQNHGKQIQIENKFLFKTQKYIKKINYKNIKKNNKGKHNFKLRVTVTLIC